MTPAFATSSAILKPALFHSAISNRSSRTPRKPSRAPHMTSVEIVHATPPEPTPSRRALPPTIPDPCPPLVSALYDILSEKSAPADALNAMLAADCTWDTPILTSSTRKDIISNMMSFLSFAVEPSIRVFEVTQSSTTASYSFTWTLSWNYPLPWRPRVAISGSTTVELDGDLVQSLQDKWYVSPLNIIAQTLPTLPDFIWLWPAPHAETDRGSRSTLHSTWKYSIIRQAPREEFRIRATLQTAEQNLVWATPALPEDAFEGNLRKMEVYSTVSPISLRRVSGDVFEWSIAVPGAHVGSGNVRVVQPSAEEAEIVEVGERNFAVVRFRGYSKREEMMDRLEKLRAALVRDGIIGEKEVEECPFWIRVYNAKVGFNSSGSLAMAMYGSSKGVPRINEIAIELTGKEGIQQFL